MVLQNFNTFVGTSTGCLKGVVVGTDSCNIRSEFRNLTKNKAELSNKNEITCMEWTDESCNQIIVGFRDKVKLFDISLTEYSNESTSISGNICGVFKENRSIFAACTSGIVKTYDISNTNNEWSEYMNLNNGSIERMRRSFVDHNVIASGGKNNDLKLWDLQKKAILFSAKNIKPDELQLQVPIWVSDIAFARRSEKVSICSRHGHVRLYDPLLPQRRPVFNAHQEEQVFVSLSATPNEHQLLVGSGTGDIFLVDTRGKVAFIGKYKGSCGSIKSICCPDDNNLVFTVSLDRHFRIYDFKTRKLLFKTYMQSKLTSLLSKTPFSVETFEIKKEEIEEVEIEEIPKKKKKKMTKNLDDVFDKLEKIENK